MSLYLTSDDFEQVLAILRLHRICLIRKVYTSQVLLIKKKLVLEQSGGGDTEQ